MSNGPSLKITIFDGEQKIISKSFDRFPITIGRSKQATIALTQYEFLSRQHMMIAIEDNMVNITDMQSANGMYLISGQRIKKVVIEDELQLKIGQLRLLFELSLATQVLNAPDSTASNKEISLKSFDSAPLKIAEDVSQYEDDKSISGPPKASSSTAPSVLENFVPLSSAPFVPPDQIFAPVQPQKQPAQPQTPKVQKLPNQAHIPQYTPPPTYTQDSSGKPKIVQTVKSQSTPTHPANITTGPIVLEAAIYWKNTLYDIQEVFPDQKLTIGRGFDVTLNLPTLKQQVDIAFFDGNVSHVFILSNQEVELRRGDRYFTLDELLASGQLRNRGEGYLFQMQRGDELTLDMGDAIELRMHYVQTPKIFTKKKMIEPDEELRRTALMSGIFHLFLIMIAIFNKPENHAPKIKNIPERYARLLVEPPRKLIEVKKPELPKPTPTPPPPKQEKKPPIPPKQKPIPQPRPKKVVITEQKVMKKVNQFPMNVTPTKSTSTSTTPTAPTQKPVNVEAIGALGALGAISNSAPSDQPVAVNINKNAGGAPGVNTGGVIGALKAPGGQLVAGGSGNVKTKGLGYGSGKDFGVQGLKGTAGTRAVGGTVGVPQLVALSVSEGLTNAQVMAVVKQYTPMIQQCYERSLFNNPNIKGRVEYEWEINPQGTVTEAHVRRSDIAGADELNNCVIGVFRKMKFPAAKNGEYTRPNIGFPFGRM